MTKKQEINENLNKIWGILHMSRECIEFSYYFHRPNSQEEADYINKSQHLQFIRHVLWRNAAIELSKLLSKSKNSHKYNIHNFISKFGKGKYYGNFQIEEKVLRDWSFKLENLYETTSKILLLRDKVYSHTDKIDIDPDVSPSFEDTKEVIKLIEDIIQDISSRTIKVYFDMRNVVFDRERFFMIEHLVEYEKHRLKKLSEKYNPG
ncbi:hypothetical protein FGF1_33980 [Flavobacteriaceae bacterium GF1]